MERWPIQARTMSVGDNYQPTLGSTKQEPSVTRTGHMGLLRKACWMAVATVAAYAAPALAQPNLGGANLGAPVWEHPIPLMWDHRDEGFFFAVEGVAMRINNPMQGQVIMRRGVYDYQGLIRGTGDDFVVFQDPDGPAGPIAPTFVTTLRSLRGTPGQFVGSGETALASDTGTRDLFQPGVRLTLGYRLRNGIAFEAQYWGQTAARNRAYAGIISPFGGTGTDDLNSFISAPFYNFSPYFAGPQRDIVGDVNTDIVPPGSTGITYTPAAPADLIQFGGYVQPAYGIFNGAENASISFTQKFKSFEANVRVPVSQFEGTRTYWTGGFRYISTEERFRLRIEDLGLDEDPVVGGSDSRPEWAMRYTTKIKNRFYGLQTGVGGEAYLLNGFAVSVDGKVGLLAETSRMSVTVQRLDLQNGVGLRNTNNQINMAGLVQGGAYLWWYPAEGIQVKFGYEYLGIIGARRSPEPIDFDLGRLNPRVRNTYLSIDGIVFGVGMAF